jgi:hypothetical protein
MDDSKNFVWFIGVVENIEDPEKLGRVKVRMINEYSNRVATDDIPWATPMLPITGGAINGLGDSPVGIQTGTRVIGFFMDGNLKRMPMIIGVFPFIDDGALGHSVSKHARGEGPVDKEYIEELGERKTAYASQYPYNKTLTTRNGHVIEIDDTPSAERIHIFHKSGAYIEMFPDGSIITKSPQDHITISVGDNNLTTSNGNINIVSNNGKVEIISDKDIILKSKSGVVNIQAPMIGING